MRGVSAVKIEICRNHILRFHKLPSYEGKLSVPSEQGQLSEPGKPGKPGKPRTR